MKTIVAYVKPTVTDKGEFYPFHTEAPAVRFRALAEALEDRGAELVLAVKGTYLGSARFRNVMRLVDGKWTKTKESVKASVIFIKSRGLVQDIEVPKRLASHPYLESLSDDRRQLYQELAAFMPKTFVIDAGSWSTAFKNITTEKVILKPAFANGSQGLQVVDRDGYEVDAALFHNPYIAQEFIDTSKGLSGYSDTYYEVRLHSMNGRITAGLVRKASAGKQVTQPNRVGCVMPIPDSKIPKKVLELAKRVDQQLSKYSPRFYAMDLLVGTDAVYLGALSSAPALPEVRTEGVAYVKKFNTLLADYLLSRA
jgi:hypothetical protein